MANADRKQRDDGDAGPIVIAEREAEELIAHLRRQLLEVARHLDVAEVDLRSRSSAALTKKVARLRLISDDLSSALKFASKFSKN